MKINWDEYKAYKASRMDSAKLDNFQVLLEFIRSYYNINGAYEIFELLHEDGLSKMMLEKRNINKAEDLENYLFKQLRR